MNYDLIDYNELDTTRKDCYYVYVLLDSRKEGEFTYGDFTFPYEPFYVGKGIGRRWRYHFWKSKEETNKIKARKIEKIKKEGFTVFCAKIFYTMDEYEAFKEEQVYIDLIGKIFDNTGPLTNISSGIGTKWALTAEQEQRRVNNRRGFKHTEEAKAKMSRNRKGITAGANNPNYGKTHSEEVRQKISDALKARPKELHSFYGKTHSEEVRSKLSLGKIKHKYQILSPEGNIHIVFSITKYCKAKGICRVQLFKSLNKDCTASGYKMLSRNELPSNWKETVYYQEYLNFLCLVAECGEGNFADAA